MRRWKCTLARQQAQAPGRGASRWWAGRSAGRAFLLREQPAGSTQRAFPLACSGPNLDLQVEKPALAEKAGLHSGSPALHQGAPAGQELPLLYPHPRAGSSGPG